MGRTNALAALGGRGGAGTRVPRARKGREWVFRIFLNKGAWWIDLRKLSLGRMMMRDPADAGWPAAGRTTTDESEAQRWAGIYADRVSQLTQAHERRTDRKQLRPEFDAFLVEKGNHEELTASTIRSYRSMRAYLVDFFGEDVDPRNITPGHIKRLDTDWVRRGLESSTRQRYRGMLRVFFRWVGFNDAENPAALGITLPKGRARKAAQRAKVKWWSADEMELIRSAATALDREPHHFPSYSFTLALAVGCGARQGELFALRYEFLDWNTGCVGIRDQIDSRTGVIRWTKGKEPRWAVMFPDAWDALPEQRRGLVLPDPRTGEPVRPRHQREMLVRLRAKVCEMYPGALVWPKGKGWHSFRHTYATRVLDAGCPMEDLQQFLGHSSLEVSQENYQHYAPDRAVRRGAALVHGGKAVQRTKPRLVA